MVMLYLMTLWKEVLQPTLVILALDLLVIVKGPVNLIKHGQEQYQYAYVSQNIISNILPVHIKVKTIVAS